MQRFLISAALLAAAGGAWADDCDALGIPDPAQAESLCAELRDLGAERATSRSLSADDAGDDPVLEEWREIGLIQDAFRADPRKTLELIRRIKDAGGLTSQ